MNAADRAALLDAAELLTQAADDIRSCSTTTGGVWPDPEDKALHDACLGSARKLKKIAAKARP